MFDINELLSLTDLTKMYFNTGRVLEFLFHPILLWNWSSEKLNVVLLLVHLRMDQDKNVAA